MRIAQEALPSTCNTDTIVFEGGQAATVPHAMEHSRRTPPTNVPSNVMSSYMPTIVQSKEELFTYSENTLHVSPSPPEVTTVTHEAFVTLKNFFCICVSPQRLESIFLPVVTCCINSIMSVTFCLVLIGSRPCL